MANYNLNPSKIGADLKQYISLVYEQVPGILPEFITIEVETFIRKAQKLFSTFPIRQTHKIIDFRTALNIFAAYDEDIALFKKQFDKDFLTDGFNADGNLRPKTKLLYKLISSLLLNQYHYGKVISFSKKVGAKDFEEFEFQEALYDSNKALIKQVKTQRRINQKTVTYQNNQWYVKKKDGWYKLEGSTLADCTEKVKLKIPSLKYKEKEENLWLEPTKLTLLTTLDKGTEFERVAAMVHLHAMAKLDVSLSFGYMALKTYSKDEREVLFNLIAEPNKLGDNFTPTISQANIIEKALRYGSETNITTTRIGEDLVYSLSKSNPLLIFNKSNEERLEKGELLPTNNVYLSAELVDFFGQGFNDLNPAQLVKYFIGTYNLPNKKAFINVGQLEGNKTNFMVKKTVKDYVNKLDDFVNDYINGSVKNNISDVIANYEKVLEYLEVEEKGFKVESSAYDNLDLDDTNDFRDLSFRQKGFQYFFNHIPELTEKFKVNIPSIEDLKAHIESLKAINLEDYREIIKERLHNNAHKAVDHSLRLLESTTDNIAALAGKKENKYGKLSHRGILYNMYLNYIIQTDSIYRELYGDKYYHAFKNATSDFVKRAKSLGSNGEDVDKHTVKVIEDDIHYLVIKGDYSKEDYQAIDETTYLQNKDYYDSLGEVVKMETSDGQAYNTHLHKLNIVSNTNKEFPLTEAYYIYLISGGLVTIEDGQVKFVSEVKETFIEKLNTSAKNNGFKNGLFKGVTVFNQNGKFYYLKQSEYTPERHTYMRFVDKDAVAKIFKGIAEVNRGIEKIKLLGGDPSHLQGVLKKGFTKLYTLVEPIVGQETLFNRMKEMETTGIDMLVHNSGSKTNNSTKVLQVPFGGKKSQTSMPNEKNLVQFGTQMENYILQDLEVFETVVEGKAVSSLEAAETYSQAIADFINYKSSIIESILIEDGKVNEDSLREVFKKMVGETRSSEYFEQFYEKDTLPDLPHINNIYLQTLKKLMNFPLQFKVNGEAYHLVASSAYNVVEVNGRNIPLSQRHLQENYRIRPLQAVREYFKDGKWQSIPHDGKLPIRELQECVIPATEPWMREYIIDREVMSQSELDSKYPTELFYMIGNRIPTENKRSIAAFKIVDFLMPHTGSIMITTTPLMRQAGSDHDADKQYTLRMNAVKVGDKWEKVNYFTKTDSHINTLKKGKTFDTLLKKDPTLYEKFKKTLDNKNLPSIEAIQNRMLDSALALYSNKYTLDSGLQRESTDTSMEVYKVKTKEQLGRIKQEPYLTDFGTYTKIIEDITNAVAGKEGVSISASSVKLREIIEKIGSYVPGDMTFGSSIPFNMVATIKNKELISKIDDFDKLFVEKYNEWSNLNYPNSPKVKHNPYNLASIKAGILVSVCTDYAKNDFGLGLNLNNITLSLYLMGAYLNIPTNILLHLGTHPAVREIGGDLVKLKSKINEYRAILKSRGFVNKDGFHLKADDSKLTIDKMLAYDKDRTNIDENSSTNQILAEFLILQKIQKLNKYSKDLLSFNAFASINKGDFEIATMYGVTSLLSKPLSNLNHPEQFNKYHKLVYGKDFHPIEDDKTKNQLPEKIHNSKNLVGLTTNSLGKSLGIDSVLPFTESSTIDYANLGAYLHSNSYIKTMVKMMNTFLPMGALNSFEQKAITDIVQPDAITPEFIQLTSPVYYGNLHRIYYLNKIGDKTLFDNKIEMSEVIEVLKDLYPENKFITAINTDKRIPFIPGSPSQDAVKMELAHDLSVLLNSEESITFTKPMIIDGKIVYNKDIELTYEVSKVVKNLIEADMFYNMLQWSTRTLLSYTSSDSFEDLKAIKEEYEDFQSTLSDFQKSQFSNLLVTSNSSFLEQSFGKLATKDKPGIRLKKAENVTNKLVFGKATKSNVIDIFKGDGEGEYLREKGLTYKRTGDYFVLNSATTNTTELENSLLNSPYEEVEENNTFSDNTLGLVISPNTVIELGLTTDELNPYFMLGKSYNIQGHNFYVYHTQILTINENTLSALKVSGDSSNLIMDSIKDLLKHGDVKLTVAKKTFTQQVPVFIAPSEDEMQQVDIQIDYDQLSTFLFKNDIYFKKELENLTTFHESLSQEQLNHNFYKKAKKVLMAKYVLPQYDVPLCFPFCGKNHDKTN